MATSNTLSSTNVSSSAPRKVDLEPIYRGDTQTYKLKFTTNTGAKDITGWEIWFTLKHSDAETDDTNAVISKRVIAQAGADSSAGILYITLDANDTDITPKTYYYDIQRVVPGTTPIVTTIMKGKLKILRDVTRSNGLA